MSKKCTYEMVRSRRWCGEGLEEYSCGLRWIIRDCTTMETNCIEFNAGSICSNMLVPTESSNCVPSCVSLLLLRWINTWLLNTPKPLTPASSFNIYTYHSCGEWLASDSVCASIKVTLKFPVVFYGGETWSLTRARELGAEEIIWI